MEKSKLSLFKEKLQEANAKHTQEIQKFKDKISESESKILNVLAWSSIVLDAAVVKVTNELLTPIRLQ